MLKYDASERITAREALRHPYFKEMREMDARRAHVASRKSATTADIATSGSAADAAGGVNALPSIVGTGATGPVVAGVAASTLTNVRVPHQHASLHVSSFSWVASPSHIIRF